MSSCTVPRYLVRAAVGALREKAQMEAGQTSGSALIKKEDTEEWRQAQELNLILTRKLRAEPPIGEEVWHTEDGRKIRARDLEPEHARSIVAMLIRRRARDSAIRAGLALWLRPALKAVEDADAGAGAKLQESLDDEFFEAQRRYGSSE